MCLESGKEGPPNAQKWLCIHGRNGEDPTRVCGCEEDVQEIWTIAGSGHALDNEELASQNTKCGDDAFPYETYHCKHLWQRPKCMHWLWCMVQKRRGENSLKRGSHEQWWICILANKTLFGRTSVDEWLWELRFSGIRKRQPFGLQWLCISLFKHSHPNSYEKPCHWEVFVQVVFVEFNGGRAWNNSSQLADGAKRCSKETGGP